MAKFDHGGGCGCPCGLKRECDCKPTALGVGRGGWLHRELVSASMVVEHGRLSAARANLGFAEARAKKIVATALKDYQACEARFNALEAEWRELNPIEVKA